MLLVTDVPLLLRHCRSFAPVLRSTFTPLSETPVTLSVVNAGRPSFLSNSMVLLTNFTSVALRIQKPNAGRTPKMRGGYSPETSGGFFEESPSPWPPDTVSFTFSKVRFVIFESDRPEIVDAYSGSPGMSRGAVRFVPVMFW